jgi:hypothetical protein
MKINSDLWAITSRANTAMYGNKVGMKRKLLNLMSEKSSKFQVTKVYSSTKERLHIFLD